MIDAPHHTDLEHDAPATGADWRREPIFIAGIMPRSGTNFLHRLLCQHPSCGPINTTPVREDYVLHHIEGLDRFVGRLRWQWGHWGADDAFVAPLAERVGLGAASFLKALNPGVRVVTKTPSVANLARFFHYFPNSPLLLIVRDGRSVVASGMSGFGWRFETATREWAHAARAIRDFQERQAGRRFRLVTYEALNADTEGLLRDVLAFLELDAECYDFEEAAQTPVYGSSYASKEEGGITWTPKEKPTGFESRNRWSSWSRLQHERFNWLAGDELRALGYEPQRYGGPRWLWALLNHALDLRYAAGRMPRRLAKGLRAAAATLVQHVAGEARDKVDLKK